MKALLAIIPLALLAACGAKNELEPPKQASLPPKPYGAADKPTADQLLTPDAQARPERSDELLKESKERKPDPFDLPPN
ncbi:hypothetical protein [Stakelama marina]|uniref:Uncharacterized protein n=1 Tax=Stakelama marina TaxID=2826939 RepID=A0A8T4IFB4_9SPHN|nr:hypothetical protein [Stakelama marina]MBR0553151.1 hypothetical protein [Stakelama marina]